MSVRDSRFEAGEIVVGQYRVIERIGQGGMAEVWLAEHVSSGARVVLKSPLPSKLLEDPQLKDRFLGEIRKMSRLDHPHIVKMHNVLDDWRGHPVAVMHYFGGGSLETRHDIALADWLPQIASALDYMHHQSPPMYHRDVKPANIFFDTTFFPYLGDFGIAKVDGGNTLYVRTETGMTLGTPKYMSPEAVHGDRELDCRADQYSLAVVVYEQLAGRIPFENVNPDSLYQIMKAHAEQAPKRLSDIDAAHREDTSAALSRALSKSPQDRFESCGAFAAAVLESLQPQPARNNTAPHGDSRYGPRWPFSPATDHGNARPVADRLRTFQQGGWGLKEGPYMAVFALIILVVCGAGVSLALWMTATRDTHDSETTTRDTHDRARPFEIPPDSAQTPNVQS
ncbi:MAG: serine/threonine-protein kinase, partial [Pirellulaceae bacterium]